MSVDPDDYRLADFKLLLPLRASARALVIDAGETRFVRHLAGELAELHCVDTEPGARSTAQAAADGLYDLVFSESSAAARHLRPGGTLCHLSPDNDAAPLSCTADLALIGRWRAFPSWPDFRILIPEHTAGWKAAVRDLRVLPARSPLGMLAPMHPPIAACALPGRGIALYRRQANDPDTPKSLLEAADCALRSTLGHVTTRFDPMDWVAVSGRLGPGNPMLAFWMDQAGRLRRLIKLARYPDADHLPREAEQLQAIEGALGPQLATRVIRPTAATRIDGRAVLAYDYVPTFPFFGLRWRLRTRHRFCRAMTDWLSRIATITRRDVEPDHAERLHRAFLRQLIERAILTPALQSEACRALAWLDAQPTLPTVFEHGDLGIYNTRMTAADGSDFRVLDWGSSTFEGIALGDLAYLLSSARAPVALGAQCLRHYLRALQIPSQAATPLWWAYLARRWAELDSVRTPLKDDPASGGGLLLAVHGQIKPCLDALE